MPTLKVEWKKKFYTYICQIVEQSKKISKLFMFSPVIHRQTLCPKVKKKIPSGKIDSLSANVQ